jgi:hypothetical protein
MTTPYTHSDDYIEQVLVTAGILVDAEITLGETYTYDITGPTISPDPVTEEDYLAIALFPLKAACILLQGDYRTAIAQGIKVRDGDSAIDTSVSFRGWSDILTLGPCKSYNNLVWKLQSTGATGAGVIGGAVVGPYRSSGDNITLAIEWFYNDLSSTLTRAVR